MAQFNINSREQLEALLKNKPKTVTRKPCNICGGTQHRVIIKGVERWMGCDCSKIKIKR